MKFYPDLKAIPHSERMAPDEGWSHHESIMVVEPFLHKVKQPTGETIYYPALEIAIYQNISKNREMAIVDFDQPFEHWDKAGNAAHALKHRFLRSFLVLRDQIIIPNIQAFAEEES